MAEIIDIMIIVDKLRETILYKNIKNIRIYPISRYYNKGFSGFNHLLNNIHIVNSDNKITVDLNLFHLDGNIDNIFIRGKLLFFEINISSSNNGSKKLTLMTSFGNTGRYSFIKMKTPSFSLEFDDNGSSQTLFFEDYDNKSQFKCFAYIEEYELAIKGIGIDYLNSKVDLNYFREKILSPRMKDITLYKFLTNQKWVSGLGEKLTKKIISESNLNKELVLGSLSLINIENLFNIIKTIIIDSYLKQKRIK